MQLRYLLSEGHALTEAAKKTYVQAQNDILKHLKEKGWTVKTDLKIPWASPPEGDARVWFKAQAVYLIVPKDKKDISKFGDARSMHIPDLRTMDGPAFIQDFERTKKHWKSFE